MAITRKALQDFFTENKGVPVKAKQVAYAFRVKHKDYHKLKQLLREMADEGLLERVKKNSFTIAAGGPALTGRMQIVRKGYGFVIPDRGGKDVFVRAHNLGGAFDGDRVEVKLVDAGSRENPEGTVERVLTRARRRFVGILHKRKKFSRLVPVEDRVFTEILLPGPEIARLKHGSRVMVEVFDWGVDSGKPLGKVICTLDIKRGYSEEIVLKYELPEKFPSPVLAECRSVPEDPAAGDYAGRTDFRRLAVFTIDPEDAADFDDALSARELPGGVLEVGVHIADVSHYVRPGTRTDEEALERALSVYLHDAYVPMLPEALSSGVCSLKEDRDRLTLSVIMHFSREGELRESRIEPGVIRSGKRFDYGRAQAVIEAGGAVDGISKDVIQTLLALHRLSEKRITGRNRAGRMDFDLPEALVVRNPSGVPVEILRKPRLASHRLVEEYMITANEVVAARLAESRLPALYRIHEAPDPESLENMNYQLRALDPGLALPVSAGLSPAAFAWVIEKAEAGGWGELASLAVVQSMKRALYSPENAGHFGLASDCYTHFTSPIRRYPDLVVHRLVKRVIGVADADSRVYSEDDLEEICRHASGREQLIETAERESDDRVEALFMQDHVGETFAAMIIAVKSFGFRVRLREYYVEGFVHVSRLDDDYYVLDGNAAFFVGARHGRTYRLGQELEVILAASDPDTRRIDFVPAR
ncbi:MAG: ribonuclease R, partial [Candidatus Glassbacteria bacterium]